MPLREDLLTPIAGENPSGGNLYYDKIFDQIKEARREDADDLPEGAWERSAKKKADPRAVSKLAGEALAARSKDLRLAGWLAEAQIKMEGYAVLAPSIVLLKDLQEAFWPTIHPEIEDGTDFELRMIAVETAAKLIIDALRLAPLTRSGLSYANYLESRTVGYEKDATTDARQEARKDAIDHGKVTAEDFDQAFAASPKGLYVQASAALNAALEATQSLDDYQAEAYGDSSPNLERLRTGLEEIQLIVEALLNQRRKTEPDAVEAAPKPPLPAGAGHGERRAPGRWAGWKTHTRWWWRARSFYSAAIRNRRCRTWCAPGCGWARRVCRARRRRRGTRWGPALRCANRCVCWPAEAHGPSC